MIWIRWKRDGGNWTLFHRLRGATDHLAVCGTAAIDGPSGDSDQIYRLPLPARRCKRCTPRDLRPSVDRALTRLKRRHAAERRRFAVSREKVER